MKRLIVETEALQKDVADIKARCTVIPSAGPGFKSFVDPWQHPRVPASGADKSSSDKEHAPEPAGGAANSSKMWPLKMNGLLGAINFKDRMLFDKPRGALFHHEGSSTPRTPRVG